MYLKGIRKLGHPWAVSSSDPAGKLGYTEHVSRLRGGKEARKGSISLGEWCACSERMKLRQSHCSYFASLEARTGAQANHACSLSFIFKITHWQNHHTHPHTASLSNCPDLAAQLHGAFQRSCFSFSTSKLRDRRVVTELIR